MRPNDLTSFKRAVPAGQGRLIPAVGRGVLGGQGLPLRPLITSMTRTSFRCLICDTPGSAASGLRAPNAAKGLAGQSAFGVVNQSQPVLPARCDGCTAIAVR